MTPAEAARQRLAAAPEPVPYPVLSVDDLLALPEPSWCVRDVLPDVGAFMLFGPSYSGKSFVALDLLFRVAAGLDWFGHAVEASADRCAVYVPLEGMHDLGARVRAWRTGHAGADLSRLRVVTEAADLSLPDGLERLDATLVERGIRPSVLVVDTLALATAGLDENSNADMTAATAALKDLAVRHGCAAGVVHHTGHEAKGRPRGASSLYANLDAVLGVDHDRRITCAKLKSAQPFEPVRFALQSACGSAYVTRMDGPAALREEVQRAERTEDAVLAFLDAHPGAGVRQVCSGVTGKAGDVRSALDDLVRGGRVRVEDGPRGARRHWRAGG